MRCKVLLHGEVAVAPFASRGIRAEDQHGNSGDDNADERHDESNTPGDMGRKATLRHKTVEDGGHEKVCDTSSSVAEATGQGICRADNILIEETGGPDLTWNKTAS